MCTADRPCPTLSFAELRAVTHVLARDPRYTGPWPHVSRTLSPEVDGHAIGNRIRYASHAPLCTVPHELAHLVSKDMAHGPRFTSWYIEIARWLTVDPGSVASP